MTPENEYRKFLHSIADEDIQILKNKLELKDSQSWKLKIIKTFIDEAKEEFSEDIEPSSIKLAKISLPEFLDINKHEKFLFCIVEGNSMQGKGINSGDKLIVDRKRKLEEGQVGVFKIGNKLYVKTYKTGNFNTIILKSHNINFEDVEIEKKDLIIVGKVLSCIKEIR